MFELGFIFEFIEFDFIFEFIEPEFDEPEFIGVDIFVVFITLAVLDLFVLVLTFAVPSQAKPKAPKLNSIERAIIFLIFLNSPVFFKDYFYSDLFFKQSCPKPI